MKDNPLLSLFRHVITGYVLLGASHVGVTGEKLQPAAQWVAEIVVLLLAWLFVKLVWPWLVKGGFQEFLKSSGKSRLPVIAFFLVATVLSFGLSSCQGVQFQGGFDRDGKPHFQVTPTK